MSEGCFTKKQHFLPQFYLKRFANQDKFIRTLDLKNKRLGSWRPYPSVGYEDYFYAVKTGKPDDISQYIESWLKFYETVISDSLPNIINRILNNDHLDNDDRYTLSALMCLLWLRSPAMRIWLNKTEEDMRKKIMSLYAPERVDAYSKDREKELSREEKEKLVEILEKKSYNLEFNNAQHIRFMTNSFGFGGPGFINLFYGQKWKIYIAKGINRFVATDSPVVEWWPPRKIFYGPSFLERNKYFALTPEIFIELIYPRGSEKIKRKTLFEADDDQVMIFNILLMSKATQYVYSAEKEILDRLFSGLKNPEKLEREFYMKYEYEWYLHRKEMCHANG